MYRLFTKGLSKVEKRQGRLTVSLVTKCVGEVEKNCMALKTTFIAIISMDQFCCLHIIAFSILLRGISGNLGGARTKKKGGCTACAASQILLAWVPWKFSPWSQNLLQCELSAFHFRNVFCVMNIQQSLYFEAWVLHVRHYEYVYVISKFSTYVYPYVYALRPSSL